MKRIFFIVLPMFIVLFLPKNIAYAGPELIEQGGSGASNFFSSYPTDMQTEVANIQAIYNDKIDLENVPKQPAYITDGEQAGDERTCPFCWLFAIGFAYWLYDYGKKFKAKKRVGKNWFQMPIKAAMFAYVAHAFIHVFFASSIFLDYYWMILVDELIAAYIYYSVLITRKSKNRQTAKVKQSAA